MKKKLINCQMIMKRINLYKKKLQNLCRKLIYLKRILQEVKMLVTPQPKINNLINNQFKLKSRTKIKI